MDCEITHGRSIQIRTSIVAGNPVFPLSQVSYGVPNQEAYRDHPPLPGQVAFTEVKWKVLTPNTMEAYLEDLEAGEASVSAYYGLTTQGYENLSNNIADLKRYPNQYPTKTLDCIY